MTLHSHFFLILLLFSFLQPWRLVASTSGAEDFLKYVCEEGARLVDEIIEEEDSQSPLNIEQTTVQTDIHSISPSVECTPTNHQSSSNSASSISSLFSSSIFHLPSSTAVAASPTSLRLPSFISNLSSPTAAAVPPAFSPSIRPVDRIVMVEQSVDSLDDNIENLEKAADAVIRLSEQKNRCLASAAEATTEENVYIAKEFQTAARTSEEAIFSYCEFSKKMKEGESTTAHQFLIEGFSLECYALEQEYYARATANRGNAKQSCFSNATNNINYAAESLKNATHAKSCNKIEVANTFEKAAQYYFQAAQAAANEDNTKADYFSNIASKVFDTADALKMAAQARSEGKIEDVKVLEQEAYYYFLAAQAAVNEDYMKVENFLRAALNTASAAKPLKNAIRARNDNYIEIAEAFEKAVYYYFQAAQTAAHADRTKAENLLCVAFNINYAAEILEQADQAKKDGYIQIAKAHQQEANYHFRRAEVYAEGGVEKGDVFFRQIYDDELK